MPAPISFNPADYARNEQPTDFSGMPAAATFGESILKAQVEIARRVKNGDLPARRAMQREIARLIAAQLIHNGSN